MKPYPRDYRYKVSEDGRIFGLKGNELKQSPNRNGYMRVNMGGEKRMVNRIVAITYLGEPPAGRPFCAHKDGKRDSNHWKNLCWKTQAENEADKIEHGTACRGSRHGMCRLQDNVVKAIRELLGAGVSGAALAKTFKVHPSLISRIKSRKLWAHLA